MPQITKEQLAEALRDWDNEANAGNWPARDDDARFEDSAQWLLDRIAEKQATN